MDEQQRDWIKAEALREAANKWWYSGQTPAHVAKWLNDRAAVLEGKGATNGRPSD